MDVNKVPESRKNFFSRRGKVVTSHSSTRTS